MLTETVNTAETDIAIVGIGLHLPDAQSAAQFWDNLRRGHSSIRKLSEEELLAAGESPARMAQSNYVPYAADLKGFSRFDAEFFGFSPKEAAILDPQHRQFLECAWEAMENAGHPPETIGGPVGVFAGCGMGSYFYFNICSNPGLVDDVGMFLLRHTGNDKDFLATRVSHVFDLSGPSVNIQTACSTSLVAIHYAAQALQNGECDMALAGGSTVELPQGRGYLFKENEILSPDGACHAFDHRAEGTVFGSGAGVVALRRLSDAQADGDHIWAVIKGGAINNDGADKAGYLAPSVGGQAAAVAEAHAMAGVSADSISYVECHGTGTYLGDPIEVAALTEAFRETSDRTGFCRIGSVKTNIGHLDTAAGVASLAKVAMALKAKELPPSLGYEAPNPAIDFDNSPFSVNSELRSWDGPTPRRAGVNSLGVGGTNAHLILEEAPDRGASDASDWPFHILPLSAKSKAALDGTAAAVSEHLAAHPDLNLADVSWTLKEGRRGFDKRRVVVAETAEEAAEVLRSGDPRRVFDHDAMADPDLVFMFPGGGAQYVGMARDLYETEPVFADWMDKGLAILEPQIDHDIRALWLGEAEDAEETLKRPSVQLPLIMITEYALAQLWISWGVQPAALIGHSMGENTAACLAGVMSFEDCVGLVLLRGQLFDEVPAGGMLSVPLSVEALEPYLSDDLDVGGLNAPELTVISGSDAALEALATRLAADEVSPQRIAINIAAHSRMLEPILERFGDYLRSISLNPPHLPMISNRSGTWLTDAEAQDPEYWVAHLRGTVRFADGIGTLAKDNRIFLEVGPGKALSSLTQMHGAVTSGRTLSSLRHPDEDIADDMYLHSVIGRLWACGYEADWSQIWGEATRHRLPLPGYAFQRSDYFIEPGAGALREDDPLPERIEEVSDWGWVPAWTPSVAACDLDVTTELSQAAAHRWLIFCDETGLGAAMADRLRGAGQDVTTVLTGDAFAELGPDAYQLAPERGREGYDQLISGLMSAGKAPDRIVHLWSVTESERFRPGSSFLHRNIEQGFYSLLFLTQALSEESVPTPLHLTTVSSGALAGRGEVLRYPAKATILGPVQTIPKELPGITAALVDVLPSKRGKDALVDRILEEVLAEPKDGVHTLRDGRRFTRSLRAQALAPATDFSTSGTVLITGGFGGIGLAVAESLIAKGQGKIALVGRSPLPEAATWDTWLAQEGPGDGVSRRINALRRLRALGAEVEAFAGDVANVEDMARLRSDIEARLGPVTAVIHGAGAVDDGPMLAKSSMSIESVLSPKLHGTLVLWDCFAGPTLEHMILFSSTSTATAPAGQVDYVAANAFLNAFAEARSGGATRVTAVNWGVWSDAGMAAEAAGQVSQPAPVLMPTTLGFYSESSRDGQGHRVFEACFSADDWVLNEHRTAAGDAVLPGTAYIELIAQALAGQKETEPYTLRNLTFFAPFAVADGDTARLRTRLIRTDAGYRAEVLSGDALLHAEADVVMDAAPLGPLDLAQLKAGCPNVEIAAEGRKLVAAQAARMAFGPRWQVLDQTALGEARGVAHLSLPEAALGDESMGLMLHPALLDIATGWAMALIPGYTGEALWVPLSFGSLAVYAPLGADVRSSVELVDGSPGQDVARFNVTLTDPDGKVLVDVRDFTLRRLTEEVSFGAPAAAPTRATEPRLSAGEQRLRYMLSQGIEAAKGPEALSRALGLQRPVVYVSSMNLPRLVDVTAQEGQQAGDPGRTFERPQLETDFVAPRSDVERTLAGFWQDLLGLESVGVEDNFFDLGGHSLIAVRLFAQVRKVYKIDFPISVLFEAPTIARCAELIEAEIGQQDQGEGAGAPRAETPKRRFTHIVPMHEGDGGTRTPMFLVAGMFGNVLNLRHLAHLIGADRPFYGLQARGLLGGDAPHEDLTEAARDMIAEMKDLQPEGPYLIGGFSGGGITAYEIAQQLIAAGEEVPLVVLLDTPLPVRRPLKALDRAIMKWQDIKRGGLFYPVKWLTNRIKWELSKRRGAGETEGPSGQQFHDAEIEAAFMAGVNSYEVSPYAGPVALYRPPLRGHWTVSGGQLVNSERSYLFDDNDWGQYIASLSVTEVPGDHDSMVLEPNVRVLAGRIRARIEEAEGQVGARLREAAE